MFTTPPPPQRLPTPYRAEEAVVSSLLTPLQAALDWALAAQTAQPWIQAVRSTRRRFGRWKACSRSTRYPVQKAWR